MKKIVFWFAVLHLVMCLGCARHHSSVRVTVEAYAPSPLQNPWAPPAVARLDWQLSDR